MYQRGFFSKSDISRFVLANLRFRLTGKENPEEISRWQDAATDFIGGHKVKEIAAMGSDVYDKYVSPALWQGTIDIAQTHLSNDEEVWLVTATPEIIANLIAERLGFSGALGSKAESENGAYTGRMVGKLLHGKEKVTAIQDLARERGFDLKDCYAYSDSSNDLPLLLAVGHPSAINPDALLRIHALREGWPIHDFRRARFLNRILGAIVTRISRIGLLAKPGWRGSKER